MIRFVPAASCDEVVGISEYYMDNSVVRPIDTSYVIRPIDTKAKKLHEALTWLHDGYMLKAHKKYSKTPTPKGKTGAFNCSPVNVVACLLHEAVHRGVLNFVDIGAGICSLLNTRSLK